MGLTLKAKLFLVTAASVITIAMLAFGAISSTSTFAEVLKRSNAATIALRNHTVADMMHDAIRADVYRAFFAATKSPDSRKIVEADLIEHATAFRSLARIMHRA